MSVRRAAHHAFTLIEVVLVIVIIGIIAAIAIPRFGSAAQNTQASSIIGSLKVLTNAGEVYAAEHNGLSPVSAPDGSVDATVQNFIDRLTGKSAADGATSGNGLLFGPYIRALPPNPYNHLATIRIDGAAAGANTDGWRYDSTLRVFQADDSAASAAVQPDGT